MIPEKKGNTARLVCRTCKVAKKTDKEIVLKEKTSPAREVKAVETQIKDTQPRAKVDCPACNSKEAFYRTEQTRAADEPETEIYTCVKCGKVWRKY